MIVYKLTDADGYCRRGLPGETLHEVGKTYTSDGNGDLCTRHWRHAYEHPLLAVLHDPIHGEYGKNARLWECDTLDGTIKRDGQMKLGTTKLKVLREIKKPQVKTEQRIAYAISCSLRVYAEESYVKWAENWLSGKDRSEESAAAAAAHADAYAAYAAARAAWNAAAYAEDAAEGMAWYAGASAAAIDSAKAVVWSDKARATNHNYAETIDLLDCAREIYLIE